MDFPKLFTPDDILEADRIDYNMNILQQKRAKQKEIEHEAAVAKDPGKFQQEFVTRMSRPKSAPQPSDNSKAHPSKLHARTRTDAFATSGGLYLRRLRQSEQFRVARAQAQNLQIQQNTKADRLKRWKNLVSQTQQQIQDINKQIANTTKELVATQKYITGEQVDQVARLNSSLDVLKQKYETGVLEQLNSTRINYEDKLLEASTILEASKIITDARVFRKRSKYMQNVHHAQALMAESDALESDVKQCQDELRWVIADQNVSQINADKTEGEIESMITQIAELDSKSKFHCKQLQALSQPDNAQDGKKVELVEDKTLFTSLLRPKTADTNRGSSASSYQVRRNSRPANAPVQLGPQSQKQNVLKNISDSIDKTWKCPAEIVRFLYLLEQKCLLDEQNAQNLVTQKTALERLSLIHEIQNAIMAEEQLIHMRNSDRLFQITDMGSL